KRLVPGAGTRRWPRGTTPLAGRPSAPDRSRPPSRPPAITGGARLRLLRAARTVGTRFGQRLGDDLRGRSRTGLPPPPARSGQTISATLFPSSPLPGMLHPDLASRSAGWPVLPSLDHGRDPPAQQK